MKKNTIFPEHPVSTIVEQSPLYKLQNVQLGNIITDNLFRSASIYSYCVATQTVQKKGRSLLNNSVCLIANNRPDIKDCLCDPKKCKGGHFFHEKTSPR